MLIYIYMETCFFFPSKNNCWTEEINISMKEYIIPKFEKKKNLILSRFYLIHK